MGEFDTLIFYIVFTPVPYALFISFELFGAYFSANVCCVVYVSCRAVFDDNWPSEARFLSFLDDYTDPEALRDDLASFKGATSVKLGPRELGIGLKFKLKENTSN